MSGSSKQTQQQSSQSAPWGVQAPYLSTAFNEAQNAYNTAKTAQAPTDFTAQFTPDQLAAYGQMLGFGTGNSNVAGSSLAAGNVLTGAGSTATADALSKLAGYTPLGGLNSNINAGNSYAAGQDIPSLVQAAMRDATRTASEQTLPQIARNAAGTGNINSSRRAISEGIVQRGLNDQAGDLSATLRQNAFDTGAKLNEANTEATNNNILSSIMGYLGGGNNAVSTGVNANTGGVGQQSGLFDIANAGIAGQNAGSQANLTNQQQQFEAKTNDPFAALNNFYNIIGANNWGGTSSGTSTTTSTPSAWQVIGGLLNAGGSFLHSDRRIKKDIAVVGELFDGTPVYRFRYKGDVSNTLRIGLMAQDVEETYPEAVIEINGVKAVNYDLATRASIIH